MSLVKLKPKGNPMKKTLLALSVVMASTSVFASPILTCLGSLDGKPVTLTVSESKTTPGVGRIIVKNSEGKLSGKSVVSAETSKSVKLTAVLTSQDEDDVLLNLTLKDTDNGYKATAIFTSGPKTSTAMLDCAGDI